MEVHFPLSWSATCMALEGLWWLGTAGTPLHPLVLLPTAQNSWYERACSETVPAVTVSRDAANLCWTPRLVFVKGLLRWVGLNIRCARFRMHNWV